MLEVRFLLTLVVGTGAGLLVNRLRFPGAIMIGAIAATVTLGVGFELAYVPGCTKVVAQIIAGAFIGANVEKHDLPRLKSLWKPALVLMSAYLVMNLVMGWLIYQVSPLDLLTALFCAVPGGLNDIPLIAADMGADAPKVTVLQFVRMVVGMGILPGVINKICARDAESEPVDREATTESDASDPIAGFAYQGFFTTLVTAFLFGGVGWLVGVPAGALVFSLVGIVIRKLRQRPVVLPRWLKRLAQILAGVYIGCLVDRGDLYELPYLLVPAVIVVISYSTFCLLGGHLLRRVTDMSRKEALLVCTPAGAADMALISMDMGVKSTDLIVLQVIRLVTVSSIFPQLIGLLMRLVG